MSRFSDQVCGKWGITPKQLRECARHLDKSVDQMARTFDQAMTDFADGSADALKQFGLDVLAPKKKGGDDDPKANAG